MQKANVNTNSQIEKAAGKSTTKEEKTPFGERDIYIEIFLGTMGVFLEGRHGLGGYFGRPMELTGVMSGSTYLLGQDGLSVLLFWLLACPDKFDA